MRSKSNLTTLSPELRLKNRSQNRKRLSEIGFAACCNLLLLCIYGLPACAIALLLGILPQWGKLVAAFVGPLGYAVLFAVIAGLLSRPFHKAIIPGKFPKDLQHPIYRKRPSTIASPSIFSALRYPG